MRSLNFDYYQSKISLQQPQLKANLLSLKTDTHYDYRNDSYLKINEFVNSNIKEQQQFNTDQSFDNLNHQQINRNLYFQPLAASTRGHTQDSSNLQQSQIQKQYFNTQFSKNIINNPSDMLIKSQNSLKQSQQKLFISNDTVMLPVIYKSFQATSKTHHKSGNNINNINKIANIRQSTIYNNGFGQQVKNKFSNLKRKVKSQNKQQEYFNQQDDEVVINKVTKEQFEQLSKSFNIGNSSFNENKKIVFVINDNQQQQDSYQPFQQQNASLNSQRNTQKAVYNGKYFLRSPKTQQNKRNNHFANPMKLKTEESFQDEINYVMQNQHALQDQSISFEQQKPSNKQKIIVNRKIIQNNSPIRDKPKNIIRRKTDNQTILEQQYQILAQSQNHTSNNREQVSKSQIGQRTVLKQNAPIRDNSASPRPIRNFTQKKEQNLTPVKIREYANMTSIKNQDQSQSLQLNDNSKQNENFTQYNVFLNRITSNKSQTGFPNQNMRSKTRQVIKQKILIAQPSKSKEKEAIKLTMFSSIEQQTKQRKFVKKVPFNYYKIYREQRLRETIDDDDQKSLQEQCKTYFHDKGFVCTFEECKCKEEMKREMELKSREASPIHRTLYSRQKEVSIRLANPYKPCRRCCSTVHNPFKHHMVIAPITRNNNNNIKSTAKLVLMETKIIEKIETPKRAASVDSGKRRKERDLLEIDWAISKIYQDLVSSRRTYSDQVDLDQAFKDKFPNSELDIYTETEAAYNATILKNKNVLSKEQLRQIFDKSMRTLKHQMTELLLKKAFKSIQEQYEQSEDNASTIENCIKLLLRIKKMYEAKQQIQKILKQVIQREQIKGVLEELSDDCDKQIRIDEYDKLMRISQRICQGVNLLGEEHRIFKRPFVLNKVDYIDQMIGDSQYYRETYKNEYDITLSIKLNKNGKIVDINQ